MNQVFKLDQAGKPERLGPSILKEFNGDQLFEYYNFIQSHADLTESEFSVLKNLISERAAEGKTIFSQGYSMEGGRETLYESTRQSVKSRDLDNYKP